MNKRPITGNNRPSPDKVGDSVGKYKLEAFLGGGMSHVYRAQDTLIGRTVALKILTEAGLQDPEVVARFYAEGRMAGNIVHENVLGIYDFGLDAEVRPFMVMEFLRGEDLRHAIKNGNTGGLEKQLTIALQVARGLQFVHAQKIIHRDLKPENVYITATGVVKLLDFGIAKAEGTALTRAGFVLGTPAYMSPEQVLGNVVSEQTDVYAFGALLFELITSAKLIDRDSKESILYAILNDPPNLEPLGRLGAPQTICDLVAACTNKDPAQRPQGFGVICAQLERLIEGLNAPTAVASSPVVASRPAPLNAKPLLWQALGVLLGVATVAAFGLNFAARESLPETIITASGEMVLVSAGAFLFGEDKQKVSLPAFYIDKTEVTNQAYEKFCKTTGRALPADFPQDRPDYPVVNVTFLDARDFAQWAGERLPTAEQWEKAARGCDGRPFPWGSEPGISLANVHSDGLRPVTAFPNGASPFGALNMVGNVWEFVDRVMTPTQEEIEQIHPAPNPEDPWYAIRGFAFDSERPTGTVLWEDHKVPRAYSDVNLGFRCVKAVAPQLRHLLEW